MTEHDDYDFSGAWADAVDGIINGLPVRVVSKARLILHKRAWPQDRAKSDADLVLLGDGGDYAVPREAAGVPVVCAIVKAGTEVHADEARHWDKLGAKFPIKRVNHHQAYSLDGACTNLAESYFSRLRRCEQGIHHHIAGPHLQSYAQEIAWREDMRRRSNGNQVTMIATATMAAPKSAQWSGYWQRRS